MVNALALFDSVIKEAIDEGRQVFTVGIPELKLPTIEVDYDFIRDWSARTINTETGKRWGQVLQQHTNQFHSMWHRKT